MMSKSQGDEALGLHNDGGCVLCTIPHCIFSGVIHNVLLTKWTPAVMNTRLFVLLSCLVGVFSWFCITGGFSRLFDGAVLSLASLAPTANAAEKYKVDGCRSAIIPCLLGQETVEATSALYTVRNDKESLYRYEQALGRALAASAVGACETSRQELLLAMANVQRKQKRLDRAESFAKEALKIDDGRLQIDLVLIGAGIAGDRKQIEKAESLYQIAIDYYENYLPDNPSVQANLAAVLEEEASFKDNTKRPGEATRLRQRAAFLRDAEREGRISELERDVYTALHAKQRKPVTENLMVARTNVEPGQPSAELVEELRHIRFPALIVDQKVERFAGQPLQVETTRIATCSPFGREGGGEIVCEGNNWGSSAIGAGDSASGRLVINAPAGVVLVESASGEQIPCGKPGRDSRWQCTSACIDSKHHRLIAMGVGADGGVSLYERPDKRFAQWQPFANLTGQGVDRARGLVAGEDGSLFVFQTDREGRLVALIKLSRDGVVKDRNTLPSAIYAENFQLSYSNNKLFLLHTSNLPARYGRPQESTWVLDSIKGDIMAHVPFTANRNLVSCVRVSAE